MHFIGIGGYGMSALAIILLELGIRVSGSDIAENQFVDRLRKKGAEINIGHSPDNITTPDLLVYSSSITEDNIERLAGTSRKIDTIHRSQMLAMLINDKKGIAISGAHGKTTTSSMVAHILEYCEIDPTYIIGGEVISLGRNAKAGKSEYAVAEADESDGSFLAYAPYAAIVTNIEADHMENYDNNFNNLLTAYKKFLSHIKPEGIAVLCWDDPEVKSIASATEARIISYGIETDAQFKATNIIEDESGVSFTVLNQGEVLGSVKLNMHGKHNVLNALAAISTSLETGVSFERISIALSQFKGSKRRFQILGEVNGILIVDDYAHHPTEIKATLAGSKNFRRKTFVVFQPQRFSRTHLLMDDFSHSFKEADEVIINTVYSPSGEQPIPEASAERLASLIRQNSNATAIWIDSQEEIVERLHARMQPGDMMLTLGAGNIWRVAHMLLEKLQLACLAKNDS